MAQKFLSDYSKIKFCGIPKNGSFLIKNCLLYCGNSELFYEDDLHLIPKIQNICTSGGMVDTAV